jgi:hypothetical protein
LVCLKLLMLREIGRIVNRGSVREWVLRQFSESTLWPGLVRNPKYYRCCTSRAA